MWLKMLLRKMSFQAKLGFVIGIQVLVLIIFLFSAAHILNEVSQALQMIHTDSFTSSNLILNIDRDLYQALNGLEIGGDINDSDYQENLAQVSERLTETRKVLERNRELWGKYHDKDSGKTLFELLDQFDEKFNQWIALNQKNVKISEASKAQFEQARSVINTLGEMVEYSANEETAGEIAKKDRTERFFVVITSGSCLLILVLALFFVTSMIKSLRRLTAASEQIALGEVEVAVESWSKDEIGRLSTAFNIMAQNIREQSQVMEKLAAGELEVEIKIKSDRDILSRSMQKVVHNLQELIAATNELTKAASEGKLDIRGDAGQFEGGFKQLVQGINRTIDAVTGPLAEANTVLGKMADNDYTLEMSEKYQGMMLQFAKAINLVRVHLLGIQDTLVLVSKGDVCGLESFRKIGKRSENDRMIPTLIRMMEVVEGLIAEVRQLGAAAVAGNFNLRGDAGKFEGGFGMIVDGFNKTLDAMVGPIREAEAVLGELSQGNLEVMMVGDYQGGHAELKEAINTVIGSFGEVLGEINTAAQQVADSSEQVAHSSQALSQGAAEQASVMEEITASVIEISGQTQQNAVGAGQANDLALSVKENALKGNEQMQEMLKAMAVINESSTNISKIIKVIDEIAFQTNILALNAAVEAARAGQYGKGFAIVAEEVRNLAARSADAAKETTALIEGSILKVEAGTRIANDTADALNKIVVGVTRTVEVVGEIALASNEQATGIAQINQGVAQVSQVTQSNTATAEESAATSEELTAQAHMLKEMVGRFKLKGELKLALTRQSPEMEKDTAFYQGPKTAGLTVLEKRDFVKY